MGEANVKRIHKKAVRIREQLEKVIKEVDSLGIDNYSEQRWLQDYLHEEIDIALMRVRMVITKTE